MILFFDTSSLVKLFSKESGSEKVKKLVSAPDNEIIVIELACAEIISALYRKYRNNELAEEKLDAIQQAIEDQFELFTVIPINSDLIEETKKLIKQYGKYYGLRTLDAIHIAGYKSVTDNSWQFVSSDQNQLSIVQKMNYQTIVT